MNAALRASSATGPRIQFVRFAQNAVPLLTLLLVLLASPAAGGWITQSPLPTFLDIRGVATPTPQRVYLATDDNSSDAGGALFESLDGGANWVQRAVPFSLGDPLNGIQFLDSQHGWAFGNANYRTTDGGATWTELPFLGSTYSMRFYTANFGLAAGNFDHFVSHDGGLSWVAPPNGIVAFNFLDGSIGLGVSASGIYRTTNGGASFTHVLGGGAADALFLSSTTAVGIVGGNFVRSTDGGVTWTVGASAQGRRGLVPVSGGTALAWARNGAFPAADERVLRSTDGGQTWTDLGPILAEGALAITMLSAQVVIAADFTGAMFRSIDAGATWVRTFSSPGPRPGYLSSATPAFADALTGYLGYGPGFVIKTVDGGASWAQISSGSGQSLNDIDRFPGGDLIAVGDGGTVLTSTGSTPWIAHSLSSLPLVAVDVVGPQEVVVADQGGRVYRSSDRGTTWVPGAAAPASLEAHDLHFTTLLDGWVIGSGFDDGALLHTTNGGNSWTPVTAFLGGYVAVDFEGTRGWAANVGGVFYRTTNSGSSWLPGTLPGSPYSIEDMDFFDANVGYAVGRSGYAARSGNGGVTWQLLPTPNTDDMLTDIYLLGPNELWIATAADKAYYTATGGQSWAVLDIGSPGFGSFSAITAAAGGDAWTVGFQGYIEKFSGSPPPPLNRPPEASFVFAPAGLTVGFTDTSTDPDGVVVSWAWDFGDGATSTDRHPSHTYAAANTHIVRLTVTDDDGGTGLSGRFLVVQPNPGGTFGDFTEVTPLTPLFVTPQDEDFWVSTTAAADYDGDNDLDIAVLGYYVVYNQSVVERLVLLRNDGLAGPGQWGFTPVDVPLGTLTAGASDLAWGDVDNDGDEDLAVGTDGETVIYRNDAGVLGLTNTILPGYYEDNDQGDFDLHSMSWADFDNDGDLDLLIPSVFDFDTSTARTVLMRNDGPNGNGGWSFTDANAALAPTGHAQSVWADFDHDQDLDLLLVDLAPLTDEGFIRRYRNDGGGVFVGQDILGPLTVEHGEAQWGDYDDDGDFDILVAGNIKEVNGTYTQALRIYRNDAETYVPSEVIPCIPCDGWFDMTAATWADYDSDGDVDILLTGTYNSGSQIEGRARIYANQGGVFTDSGNDLPAPRASGTRGGTFTWLDLDGDLDLDYFIAGEYFVPGGNGLIEAQMHAYRNDAPGQNAAPSSPTGLTASAQGGHAVRLSWSPANDGQTPASALTYDLDLYRDGVPVVIPRRLPEPGNVSSVNEWLLGGLADGNYRWTLRAVDSAYNGGPAAIGVFSVGNTTGAPPMGDLPHSYEFSHGPNPFRGSTSFRFALPEKAEVSLAVYDVSGRLVTQLASGARPAGVYDIPWDAGGLANGAYFARFTTPTFKSTRRIMIVR